jgi:cell wall assembly regulator SMI1
VRLSDLEWTGNARPASEAELATLESQLGHRFPSDHRLFLLHMPGSVAARTQPALTFLSADPADGESIGAILDLFGAELTEALVPFAADPIGDLVAFDYQGSPEDPSVVFWRHGGGETALLARSLSEFLHLVLSSRG